MKLKSLEGFKANLSRHKKELTDLKIGQFRLSSLRNRKNKYGEVNRCIMDVSKEEEKKGQKKYLKTYA